jgi:4-hydroxy 2-oxovalerate aldolase
MEKRNRIEILDCTIRDGGYYNFWDFSDDLVDEYVKTISQTPVNFIEVGYRSKASKGFKGMYYNISQERLDQIRAISNVNIALMVDLKHIQKEEEWDWILGGFEERIDLLRLTYNPLDKAEKILKHIKYLKSRYDFKIALNMMYASKWTMDEPIFNYLKKDVEIDYFYVVDSYGGLTPNDTLNIFDFISKNVHESIKIGFHGHNNLELALANSIAIIDKVDIVDATILGMGRGAGNLKLELFLTYLKFHNNFHFELTHLTKLTTLFKPLLEEYQWGTNLPYMIAGVTSFPQSEVMNWVQTKVISLDTMVNSITDPDESSEKEIVASILPQLKEILLVGGGPSVKRYIQYLKLYLKKYPNTAIIFSSTKHIEEFDDLSNKKYLSIVGDEEMLPSYNLDSIEVFYSSNHKLIKPHIRGIKSVKSFKLPKTELFETKYPNHLANCANLIFSSNPEKIEVVGYDGYDSGLYFENGLYETNNKIFARLAKHISKDLVSLTPTRYNKLEEISIFYKI